MGKKQSETVDYWNHTMETNSKDYGPKINSPEWISLKMEKGKEQPNTISHLLEYCEINS